MSDETADETDVIGDDERPKSITVPVEIPLDDEVHQASWQNVTATSATEKAARERIGESVAEALGRVNLQALVYQEFCQIKQQRQQAATQMLQQAAGGGMAGAQPAPPETNTGGDDSA